MYICVCIMGQRIRFFRELPWEDKPVGPRFFALFWEDKPAVCRFGLKQQNGASHNVSPLGKCVLTAEKIGQPTETLEMSPPSRSPTSIQTADPRRTWDHVAMSWMKFLGKPRKL